MTTLFISIGFLVSAFIFGKISYDMWGYYNHYMPEVLVVIAGILLNVIAAIAVWFF